MLIHSPKELGFYMSDRRKSLALSQYEASDAVGLRQATLSTFENHPDGGKVATQPRRHLICSPASGGIVLGRYNYVKVRWILSTT